MPVLYKTLIFQGNKGQTEVKALFDSGASASFVRTDIADKVGYIFSFRDKREIIVADGSRKSYDNRVLPAGFMLNDCPIVSEFKVVDNLSEEVIVGADTLQRNKITLDFDKDEVNTDKCPKFDRL